MSKEEAIRRLTALWNEQVGMFPWLRDQIPLAIYINRNIDTVLRYRLLDRYSK
jgi:hypothetical protein